jgi:hypothetical protein
MRELSDSDLEFFGGKDVMASAKTAIDNVNQASAAHQAAARDVQSLSARLASEASSQLKPAGSATASATK